MKRSEFKDSVRAFIKMADADSDPYLLVHFSREEDKYTGLDDRMDPMDALVVIRELIRIHNLSPEIIAGMGINSQPKETNEREILPPGDGC